MASDNDPAVQGFLDNPNNSKTMKDFLEIFHGHNKKSDAQLERIDVSTTRILSRVKTVESELTELKARMAETDPAEIRFKGIPRTTPEYFRSIISAILNAINCSDAIGQIIQVREWILTPRRSNVDPIPTLVAKFSSVTVRNFVMQNKRVLFGKTFSGIVGSGPNTPIFMDAITGKIQNDLAHKARIFAKESEIPNPRIRGKTLLMRRSPNEPPVTILTTSDLHNFATSCQSPSSFNASQSTSSSFVNNDLQQVDTKALSAQIHEPLLPSTSPCSPMELKTFTRAPGVESTQQYLPDHNKSTSHELAYTQLNGKLSAVPVGMTETLDNHALLKTIEIDPYQKPRSKTPGLDRMNCRDKMYKRASRVKSPVLYSKYRRLRNDISRALADECWYSWIERSPTILDSRQPDSLVSDNSLDNFKFRYKNRLLTGGD